MSKRVNLKAHESQLNLEKVDSGVLLELFPFALILDHDMRIKGAGEKVFESWIIQNPQKKPEIFIGSYVTDCFKLRRPKGITFNWSTVTQMHFVIFELELMCSGSKLKAGAQSSSDTNSTLDLEHEDDLGSTATRILLKGQMRHMHDIDAIVFLCSPLLVYTYFNNI